MFDIKFHHQEPLNIKEIADVFEKSFNQPFDNNYWKWRFEQNPNADKIYISYVKNNGKLVAYYAVSPSQIIVDGKIHKIALSNMTMTHPDFRGKGFFKELALKLYAELANDGFLGVIGFANTNSHYGFRKHLNWHDILPLSNFTINPQIVKQILQPNKEIQFKIEPMTDSLVYELANLNFSDAEISLSRSYNNLLWRLSDPLKKYLILTIKQNNKIIGAAIIKYYNDTIDVLELFYESDKTIIYNYVVHYLLNIENKKLNFWQNIYKEDYLIFEKMGFVPAEFQTYFGVIPFEGNGFLAKSADWHIRSIDSDVF